MKTVPYLATFKLEKHRWQWTWEGLIDLRNVPAKVFMLPFTIASRNSRKMKSLFNDNMSGESVITIWVNDWQLCFWLAGFSRVILGRLNGTAGCVRIFERGSIINWIIWLEYVLRKVKLKWRSDNPVAWTQVNNLRKSPHAANTRTRN